MSFIGLLRTLEQITRPPRLGHDVDAPLTAQCFDEYDDYPGHRGIEGESHHCTRAVQHDGDHECGVCEVLWERACRSPADCAAYDCQGDCEPWEPELNSSERVALRQLIEDRFGDQTTNPDAEDADPLAVSSERAECGQFRASHHDAHCVGPCSAKTSGAEPAPSPTIVQSAPPPTVDGEGPASVRDIQPSPEVGRPTSELLTEAAELILVCKTGQIPLVWLALVDELRDRAATFKAIEASVPKLNIPNGPRYATCRVCHGSIANRGKGWYHGPERPIGVEVPAHYAEPMARAVQR